MLLIKAGLIGLGLALHVDVHSKIKLWKYPSQNAENEQKFCG